MCVLLYLTCKKTIEVWKVTSAKSRSFDYAVNHERAATNASQNTAPATLVAQFLRLHQQT